jgi:hypothetical protein
VPGCRQDVDFFVLPPEDRIVLERARHRDVLRDGVEVVADVIKMEDAAVAPEVLRVGKQVPLVSGNGNGNAPLHSAVIALALIPVVMSVQDVVYLRNTKPGEVVKDFSGAEIDEHAGRAVADDVNVAGVRKDVQVVR